MYICCLFRGYVVNLGRRKGVPSRGFLRNETLKEKKEKFNANDWKKNAFDLFCRAKLILNFVPGKFQVQYLFVPGKLVLGYILRSGGVTYVIEM